jgi:uncharacterized membrane protein YedE/YeeE
MRAMGHFTPLSATLGGVLLGLASSLLFLTNGRILGVSGILSGAVAPPTSVPRGDRLWRLVFLAGILTGGLAVLVLDRGALAFASEQTVPLALVAGVFVGVGTRIGGGCTSGHGLCGIARLSKRSIVATSVFIASGAVVVFIVRHVLHAAGSGTS